MTDRTPDTGHLEGSGSSMLTALETARLAGVNERTIRRAIVRGDLIAVKDHGMFAISAAEVRRWMAEREDSQRGVSSSTTRRERQRPPVLPQPLSELIGRQEEIRLASGLLRQPGVRLLTISGPGGIGKTRLGVAVAQALATEFPEGAWFVPLAGITEPSQVIPSIMLATGVHESSAKTSAESLQQFLGARRALLVLDNFEHVLDAADDVAALLRACAGITVLVTSRSLLRISGEHVIPTPPLEVLDANGGPGIETDVNSPAVRLFAARAAAINRSFTIDVVSKPLIIEICHLLDGLPLAIELAAARTNSLSLPQLRNRLDHRLAVLTSGFRDAPRRHRTMRDAIGWSHDLLQEDEQLVFRRLAVFAGGFTLEAVEAISNPLPQEQASPREALESGSGAVADAIGTLIDRSLLNRIEGASETWFVLLETIRAYALEQLEASGEEAIIRDRHAHYCLDMVEQLPGGSNHAPDTPWVIYPVEFELDNVRAALVWFERTGDASRVLRLAIAIHSVWEERGFFREAVEWFERGMAIGGEAPLPIRQRAHAMLGRKLNRLGRHHDALLHYQEALQLALVENDIPAIAGIKLDMGGIATNLEDYDQAVPLLEEALTRYQHLNDPIGICRTDYFLGFVRYGMDDHAAAIPHLERALADRRSGRAAFNLSALLTAYGLVRCEMGELDGAMRAMEEALGVWQQHGGGGEEVLAEWFVSAARIELARNRPLQAAHLCGAGDTLADRLGVPILVPPPRHRSRLAAQLEDALGAHRYGEALAAGRAMPLEHAITQALSVDLPEPGHSHPTLTPREQEVLDLLAPGERQEKPAADLSAREMDVLRLLAAGLRDREIADELFLSVRTVEGHVARILARLNVSSRAAAVSVGIGRGIVDASP